MKLQGGPLDSLLCTFEIQHNNNSSTGILQVLLHFANIVFNKLKVWSKSISSKSIGAIFSIAFAHFVSLRHILVTLVQYFKLLHYFYICDGPL